MSATRNIAFLVTSLLTSQPPHTDLAKIIYYDSLVPVDTQLRRRIVTTVFCDDCQSLPKVESAGKVVHDNGIDLQIMHNGIKVLKDCYYGKWATVLIELCKGHHEPQEEKVFHEVLKYLPHDAVMVELGSYWAYYSLWFKLMLPEARVFLVEPDPKNIIVTRKHFELNNMTGHFTHAMVGECTKEVETFTDWDYNKHQIPQICMDDFSAEQGIDFIHILHSDIQGAEVNMLKGCKRLMREKRVGYYFISTHRGVHEECLQILQDAELEIIVAVTREESFSADGLIVARIPGFPGPDSVEVTRRTQDLCDMIKEFVHE